MIYGSSIVGLRAFKFAAASLISLLLLIMVQGTAHAAAPLPAPAMPVPSNTLPESSDFSQGNNVWLTVANQDGINYLLNAHTSVIRIYSSQQTISLNITNGGHCPGNGPDAGASEGSAQTRFDIYQLAPLPQGGTYNYSSAPYITTTTGKQTIYSNQVGCGTYTLNLPKNLNQANDYPGYAQNGKYAWEIDATWLNLGAYGWNSFKYSVPAGQGRFSYYSGSGDHFAIKADDNLAYPGGSGSFKFGFAPNCLLTSGTNATVTLKWFDADAGQSNQGGTNQIKTYIYEYDANNNYSGYPALSGASGANLPGGGVIDITSGQNVGGSVKVTIRGGHKYVWVWTGIRTANGIQFQLPTDSYNTLMDFAPGGDCDQNNPSNDNATCNVTNVNPANPQIPNSTVKVTITAKNTGTTTWNSTYYMKRVGPNVINLNKVSGSVGPGGTFQFSDTVTSPPPNGSKTMTYRMYDSTGPFGTSCTTPINSGQGNPPAGGGAISATCEQTTVSVNNITATSGGAVINTVPVAVVITDNNNPGSTYTFVVPGGVPNNGSKTFNTFDMWNGMWPHGNYTLQIFVQGSNGSPDSATYPNDGSWFQPGGSMNGPFWYPSNINGFNTQPVSNCLQAACVQGSSPDVEPGQRGTGNYTVHFENDAGRSSGWASNDPNGYNFIASTNPGLVLISGNPQPTSGPINAWNGNGQDNPAGTDISVGVTFRADWQGTYNVTFRFQGNNLALPQSLSVPCPDALVTPATRSFFQVNQGDLNTGGGFAQVSDGQCALNDPGYISPATPGYDNYAGGIRAYGNQNGGRGSSAQFGVLSLGYNLGSPSGLVGLYSRNNEVMADRPTTGNMGGLLNPTSLSTWHCINDFFLKTRKTVPSPPTAYPNNATINLDNLIASPTMQYTADGNVILTTNGCNNAGNIPRGRQVTIYVNGNVRIINNICYANTYDPSNRSDIPYFSLIVQGSIIVTSNVNRIDGLYVAQPTGPSTGIFATCDDFCPLQLTVNGAVIAQQVELLREHGTLGPLETDNNGISTDPAEVFNFIPAMIIGQPNFSPNYRNVQSLYSLPPVF